MRTYFAYIRVSTIKQGEKGSSLGEQKDAILVYAQKHDLQVSEIIEEQLSAAKQGRTAFRKMMQRLKRGAAHGLIMHKVDRGARNLADWAEIAALRDVGIDVHFAHEAIDLNSRGGRLSADIQAVVASDFIRNLREEVKKGQQGRLKQGLFPFGAMSGYTCQGGGKVKTIDPVQGPLIRETFELYASGHFTLATLSEHMKQRGLRNSVGNPLGIAALSKLLSTTFYFGLIQIKGQTFQGAHQPIISKALFDRARAHAAGRVAIRLKPTTLKGDYTFRRLITCETCQHSLYAETQKGRIYYRCHSTQCRGTCFAESDLLNLIAEPLGYIHQSPVLLASLDQLFQHSEAKQIEVRQQEAAGAKLTLAKHESTFRRLTDLFVEGSIDRETYESRKTELHLTRNKLEEQIKNLSNDNQLERVRQTFFELTKRLVHIAQIENTQEKREILKCAISNLSVSGKNVYLQWSNAISMLVDLGGSLTVRR
jgi:site-specific DNA recombinase